MFWNKNKKKTNTSPSESLPTNSDTPTKSETKIPLESLKKLIPIGQLADSKLLNLKIQLSQYKPGSIIFNRGETSTSLSYIIKGHCFLEANNGSGYEVDTSTFKALYPLSGDSLHQCTAIAKSDVSVIHFPHNTSQETSKQRRNPLLHEEDIPDHLKDDPFFNSFSQNFKRGTLTIPSLPDVAIKLRSALQKNIGVHEAVQIINLDPVISSKLIKIVNSPVYKPITAISSCHDAVNRLGLTTTRNLVTSISMQNLFKSKNKELNNMVRMLWKRSIQVSSIAQTLAIQTKKVIPDEALLAGLVHNIGAIPIIIYADSLGDQFSKQQITPTIKALQGIMGSVILNKWDFPETLLDIPSKTENWYYSNGENLDINDIILLAKFHSYMGSEQMQNLPPLHTLPAFQKLGDNTLTPDMSLQTLHDAKQQISEAMSLFN